MQGTKYIGHMQYWHTQYYTIYNKQPIMCTNLLLAVALEVLLLNASKPFISQPLCRKPISLITCTWPAANYTCLSNHWNLQRRYIYMNICGYSLGISRYCVVAQRQILLLHF